jgi:cold shock CspA family protein
MARSRERYSKKEVRERKEKKRKEKEKKRLERKEGEKKSSLDDMIAYVDEHGRITSEPPEDTGKKSEINPEDIEISVPKKEKAAELETERTGTISFYNESKGFGFIKDPDLKDDVFFHVNNVLEEIREGNKVSYTLERGKKGFTAMNVRPIK